MKTMKTISIFAAALFISTTLTAKASSPIVDFILMETPAISVIQVTAAKSVDTYVSVMDDKGISLYYERMNSETASAKVFDFSSLRNGTYFIEADSDYMNVTKTVAVNGSKVEVISKESEFKPIFSFEDEMLKINYLNQEMKDIELSIETPTRVFYEGKDKAKLSYAKQLDLSKLFSGDYYAKLEAGGKTFYHYFEIR